MSCKVTVIGAAIVDIYAGTVDKEIFKKGSVPAGNIGMSCGGDALNEAVVLSGLGNETEIISLLGGDEAGGIVKKCLDRNKVDTRKITTSADIPTATNIVLVDGDGERYFITNPKSSLRKLSKEHILPHLDDAGDIVSFASIFVSPKRTVSDMGEVFRQIKETPGHTLVADMTTAKNGETIKDLEPILKYIDYIIPNEKEASILTGESDPVKSAESFIGHGANTVIIKCGKEGCIYKSSSEEGHIPAYPDSKVIDTTGAGDSFVAGFIHGLSEGLNLQNCCRYACAMASVVVEHMGTQNIAGIRAEAEKRYQFYCN
jgi:sugar/nucleoside kinase (ribokinase family)